jgi:adenine-specific DNA-methyltransferase
MHRNHRSPQQPTIVAPQLNEDRGFVPTPDHAVDVMVKRLFADALPNSHTSVLDPGCGEGEFIEGIIRFCSDENLPIPRIVGIENNPSRAQLAAQRFKSIPAIRIYQRDFLLEFSERFTHVIGNPPYVSILQIPAAERARYRATFASARGRFDLYMLFVEQGLRLLEPNGRLVFVTPEKYLYTHSALGLRQILSNHYVESIELIPEDTFPGLITYPAITTVNVSPPERRPARVVRRNGEVTRIVFQESGESLLPRINGARKHDGLTLGDICLRISAGVATGADEIFVLRRERISVGLEGYAYPTIAGRQLSVGVEPTPTDAMLIPYDDNGDLLSINDLGGFGRLLTEQKANLLKRSCVARKPWHAFHDNVPFEDLLRPKLLCKDICKIPEFWIDRDGMIVPRHSVYYITPKDPEMIDMIAGYLASTEAKAWLQANCQHAANGFLRVQSAVLRQLPLPPTFDGTAL